MSYSVIPVGRIGETATSVMVRLSVNYIQAGKYTATGDLMLL